jgi:hypothetical protein
MIRFTRTQSTVADMFEVSLHLALNKLQRAGVCVDGGLPSAALQRRVRATPNAIGLIFEQQTFTFAEMEAQANRYSAQDTDSLTHSLTGRGVGAAHRSAHRCVVLWWCARGAECVIGGCSVSSAAIAWRL